MNKIDKNIFYEKLKNIKTNSNLIISWDRGNGPLEKKCCFKGFEQGEPALYLMSGDVFDINAIGYEFINNLEQIN